MENVNASPRTIFATLSASIVVALVALVLFILPAEYGVDPLGAGDVLGIKGMSGYTVSALSIEEQSFKEDYVEFPLGPFESIEYKYHMDAGQAMVYSWQAEGEVVFDFHSHEEHHDEHDLHEAGHAEHAHDEDHEEEHEEDSISFSVGRAAAQHGTYVAPYSGLHGWFWENRGQQEVTVKVTTRGFFESSTTFSRSGEYTREL